MNNSIFINGSSFTDVTVSNTSNYTSTSIDLLSSYPDVIATSIPDPEAYDRDEALARVEIATLAVIFVVTVVGNGTVLLALWTRKRYAGRKKLSRMYFFILHLSIADLVTAFLNTLPQLGWDITYRFNGGFLMCKIVKFCQTLGPYLSSYILMATAIDRHQAICYPLTYCSWTSRRSKVMVWLAWATSLAFCIPQVSF